VLFAKYERNKLKILCITILYSFTVDRTLIAYWVAAELKEHL